MTNDEGTPKSQTRMTETVFVIRVWDFGVPSSLGISSFVILLYNAPVPGAGPLTVHIIAYCPECQTQYKLSPDLRGRKLRCPNPNCQAIFVVREATGGSP